MKVPVDILPAVRRAFRDGVGGDRPRFFGSYSAVDATNGMLPSLIDSVTAGEVSFFSALFRQDRTGEGLGGARSLCDGCLFMCWWDAYVNSPRAVGGAPGVQNVPFAWVGE